MTALQDELARRREDGWSEQPCGYRLQVGMAAFGVPHVFACQKTVPTRYGQAYPHRDHWWEGEIAGVPASIAWKQ